MTFKTLKVGKAGEKFAAQFLLEHTYQIITTNFRTKFGEIDIIAKKNDIIYFVEVKTRIGILKGKPYEAVNKRKIQHLKYASEIYILKNNLKNHKLSLLVISIVLTKEMQIDTINTFSIVE